MISLLLRTWLIERCISRIFSGLFGNFSCNGDRVSVYMLAAHIGHETWWWVYVGNISVSSSNLLEDCIDVHLNHVEKFRYIYGNRHDGKCYYSCRVYGAMLTFDNDIYASNCYLFDCDYFDVWSRVDSMARMYCR